MFFKRNLPDPTKSLVAVDLGSNSFHMLVARLENNGIQVVDRLREMVRLGAGLDEKRSLTEETQQRALDCLQRFAQPMRDIPARNIRIVGTNTLRRARNSATFIRKAEAILGHPIEIISGAEEARLIYLGVSHSLAESGDKRLVIDIGGGSTEVIVGKHFEPLKLESLAMGCVSMSQMFFYDGKITSKRLNKAGNQAQQELQGVSRKFLSSGWQDAIGASGTVRSIAKVTQAQGWSNGSITRTAMQTLRKALLDAEHIDKVKLDGLVDERRPVFLGGYVVLQSLFDTFELEELQVSDGAVREGLIYQLLGRIKHEDIQELSIDRLMTQYNVDVEHADHVEDTALDFLKQVVDNWDIDFDEYASLLSWAARLHEIGLAISHGGYQKHGAYLAMNTDLPGFSFQQQQNISLLIRNHRRKLSEEIKTQLPDILSTPLFYLVVLLRLATIFQRSRTHKALPEINLKVKDNGLKITLPKNWLQDHALTMLDLEQEVSFLNDVGFELKIREVD